MTKALRIVAYTVTGLLLVPTAIFFVVYFALGGPAQDHGHPPAIIIPYLYLLFGFRFVAPAGAAAGLAAALLPSREHTKARYVVLAVGAFLVLGCVVAWLHEFR
jgi:hypothetical protein